MVSTNPAPTPPPAPRDPTDIQADLAKVIEAKKHDGRRLLIALGMILGASMIAMAANGWMEQLKHDEKLACYELKKSQPSADCDSQWRPNMPEGSIFDERKP